MSFWWSFMLHRQSSYSEIIPLKFIHDSLHQAICSLFLAAHLLKLTEMLKMAAFKPPEPPDTDYPHGVNSRPTQRAQIVAPHVIESTVKHDTCPIFGRLEPELSALESSFSLWLVGHFNSFPPGERLHHHWPGARVAGVTDGESQDVNLPDQCAHELSNNAFPSSYKLDCAQPFWYREMGRIDELNSF